MVEFCVQTDGVAPLPDKNGESDENDEENAPSTVELRTSQPADGSGPHDPSNWPTTRPFESITGDPELPP